MSQTIYRMAAKQDPFARIPNELLSDKRLSWRAKGILAYLCSKPPGWKMRVADLARNGTDGACAIRAALKELRACGYAELTMLREGGKIREWAWKISDTPIFSPPDSGFQHLVKPHLENRHHSKKEVIKTECRKTESKESEETSFGNDALGSEEFDAVWKPIAGNKEKQLRLIRPPADYPSEHEFDEFIVDGELDDLGMGKRPDLYRRLCQQKWQHWNGRRWTPIQNWQEYVRALNSKIASATAGG